MIGIVLLAGVATGVIAPSPLRWSPDQQAALSDAPPFLLAEDRLQPTFVVLMARSTDKAAETRIRISGSEIALLERLIESRVLIAVPQIGSAKPRRVISVSLEPNGDHVLLYLSARPADLQRGKEGPRKA